MFELHHKSFLTAKKLQHKVTHLQHKAVRSQSHYRADHQNGLGQYACTPSPPLGMGEESRRQKKSGIGVGVVAERVGEDQSNR